MTRKEYEENEWQRGGELARQSLLEALHT